jgi:transposase-like protein
MSDNEGNFCGEVSVDDFSVEVDYRGLRSGQVELLQIRLELLETQDRLLLETYFNSNLSFSQIGQLAGINKRSLARRIRLLTGGLLGDEYITIIRHKSGFTHRELIAAYDHYLLGMGYRRIARKRKMSKYYAVKSLEKLSKWVKKKDEA